MRNTCHIDICSDGILRQLFELHCDPAGNQCNRVRIYSLKCLSPSGTGLREGTGKVFLGDPPEPGGGGGMDRRRLMQFAAVREGGAEE